jgi:TPR repeat protein
MLTVNHTPIDTQIAHIIEPSRCAQDRLNLVQHLYNRPGSQWRLLQLAERDRYHKKAVSLWPQAVQYLRDLAAAGDQLAMFHLGRWHRLGIGVPEDTDQSHAWYLKGAEGGHTGCMINLARLIHTDQPDEAKRWFREALKSGDPKAHAFWGCCFEEDATEQFALGKALQEPYALLFWADRQMESKQPAPAAEVLSALLMAAEHHISEACLRLANIHQAGLLGLSPSKSLALHWASEAADLGEPMGCGLYGRLLVEQSPREAISQLRRCAMLGESYYLYELSRQLVLLGKQPQHYRESVHWLKKSAQLGDVWSMNMLARALRYGYGCRPNRQAALQWDEKAAEQGHPESQIALAMACMRGDGMPEDKARGFNLLVLASLQENPEAVYMQGVALMRGDGTEKNPEQAYECYQQAAELGLTKGILQVGMSHIWGEGTPKNIPEGVKWIKRAADLGSDEGQLFLGMMFRFGHGVQKSNRLAIKWLSRAVQQDHASAQYELAMLYQDTDPAKHQSDIQRLMSAAAAQGHDEAMDWIKTHLPEPPQWLKDLKEPAQQ